MATFSPAGAQQVALEFLLEDAQGYHGLFPTEKFIVRRKTPFAFTAGNEKVQIVGQGNRRQDFVILDPTGTLITILEALWQTQARGRVDLRVDLEDPAAFWDNVLLVDVKKPTRQVWSNTWKIPVTFEQVL